MCWWSPSSVILSSSLLTTAMRTRVWKSRRLACGTLLMWGVPVQCGTVTQCCTSVPHLGRYWCEGEPVQCITRTQCCTSVPNLGRYWCGGTSTVWYLCTTRETLLMMPHGTRWSVVWGPSIKYQVTSIERLLFIRFQELMIPHGTQWSLVRVPRSKYWVPRTTYKVPCSSASICCDKSQVSGANSSEQPINQTIKRAIRQLKIFVQFHSL